jgi:hypothetical protein
MAFTSTATQAEFVTARGCAIKLEKALQPYAQGDATKDKEGRFTEVEVQAAIDAMQAALTAIES